MRHRMLQAILAMLALVAAFPTAHATTDPTVITVLSNRADLISGGDALVEISPALQPGSVVTVDGDDVTNVFSATGSTSRGLVTGLAVGANQLTVTHADASGATLTIVNHPVEGPIFSGPHLQPWDCTTAANGLGAPKDAACNADPIVDYLYVSTAGGAYQAYDVNNPPLDVAMVTNDRGATVRNIVRRERGAINRGLYAIAYLHDPALGQPDPRAPQAGFNGKLYYPFGASCNTNQTQGSMPGVINQTRLQEGWAIATGSLNVLGHHCNPVLSAETVMMIKERVIEQLGSIRYTMATGGSGGAIGQLQVSNAYPGLVNGLMPGSMFPDVWSTAIEVADCVLTETYFPVAAIPFTPMQKAAVDGHGPPQSTCATWVGTFAPSGIPTTGCFSNSTIPTTSVPEPPVLSGRDYFPILHADGCRATVQDIQVNVWGRRPDGFAKRPLDNVGVQYGLEALNLPVGNPGKITFAQFLDMNARIGGVDIDGVKQVDRTRTDDTVPRDVYRTSMINDGRGLARTAIINFAASQNIEIHTPYHAYALEARMAKIGHADNHVIWHNGPGELAWRTMDAWLAGVEADGGIDPLTGMDPQLVKNNRPTIAHDSCWSGSAQQPLSACASQVFGDARLKAGMPLSHDNLKCVLKPIDPADYAGAFPALTASDLAALELVFPEGVCNYAVEGVDKAPSVPWLSYASGPGGQPLGLPPASTQF
ncbi:MAG TPA: DUF6351 family protein [Actinomycetota bacterium]|nr:DUF6351 family protein [Actinomycetota bacterium]